MVVEILIFYGTSMCNFPHLSHSVRRGDMDAWVPPRNSYVYSFWIVITRGICWYGFWQHWSNFWIWPLKLLYKLSCDPQASCTGCDPAAIWNGDPLTHTNIMKLSNLLFLFSWVNFGSVRPISSSVMNKNYWWLTYNILTRHYHSLFFVYRIIKLKQKELQLFHQNLCLNEDVFAMWFPLSSY